MRQEQRYEAGRPRVARRFAAAFAWCVACAALSQPRPAVAADAAAESPRAEWTLVLYLAADNDLEAAQLDDLRELLAVGSTDQVQVVALVDRHPEGAGRYSNAAVANLPAWTSAKLLHVERGRLREVADWGEVDTGDPATLDRLLQTAVREFPARRYALVLGNHGLGWQGTAVDATSSGDSLTLLELASVLQPFATAHGRLELLGFDSCLMGTLEVATAMRPYARYMVASEEIEPDEGWAYDAILAALAADPSADGERLGRIVADTFHAQFAAGRAARSADLAKGITLGVVALDRVAPLEQAVAKLAGELDASLARGGRDAWVRLARARSETENYGRAAGAGRSAEAYDLVDVAERIAKDPALASAALAASASAVAAAARAAVVHSVRGVGRPNAHGLAVFYPVEPAVLDARGESAYSETQFAQANRWYPLLRTFVAVAARDASQPRLAAPTASAAVQAADEPVELHAQIEADDLEDVDFVLGVPAGDGVTVIGSVPADPDEHGRLQESWDGAWFAIGDGTRSVVVPLTEGEELDADEDVYWAAVPLQVRLAGTQEWRDVTAQFVLDFDGADVQGDFVYAVERSGAAARELDLEPGDEVRPVYLHVAADGETSFVPATDADAKLRIGADGELSIRRERVAPGDYRVGFLAWDLAGNAAARYVDVAVE